MSDPYSCPAIVFCDLVITEQGTGKPTLVGVFSALARPSYPFVRGSFWMHITISGRYLGDVEVEARLKHPDTGETLRSMGGKPNLPSFKEGSRFEMHLNMRFDRVTFDQPAEYPVEIWVNSELIAQRTLRMIQKEPYDSIA